MSEKIKIVTHSSKFHPDDVFAVATLSILLSDKEIEIMRSRDAEIIKSGDYVVDVGEIHDPETRRFDHHQKGGAGKRENGVPYAAFGLVWKTYGETLCGSKNVAERVDRLLIQAMDALDNGVDITEAKIPGVYPVDIGTLGDIFLPTWKEDEINIDELFKKLVGYAQILIERIIKISKDYIEGEKKVLEAYENAKDKRVIELDERYPWEETLGRFPEPLFVIYHKRIDNNWTLKAIRSNVFSFTPRKKLPESWAGKSGPALEEASGVEGGVFCHNARFMAVNKTKEGILRMAEIALVE